MALAKSSERFGERRSGAFLLLFVIYTTYAVGILPSAERYSSFVYRFCARRRKNDTPEYRKYHAAAWYEPLSSANRVRPAIDNYWE
jgi:hypothetical protein